MKLTNNASKIIENTPEVGMRELEMMCFSSDSIRKQFDDYEKLFDDPELAMDQEFLVSKYRDFKESMLDFIDYIIWNNEQTNKKLDKILELL